jgi:recombination protein RecA
MIVVDSISALLPAVYFEKDSDHLKHLEDTKQIGSEAKDMTHAVKMLNYANDGTTLIFISQIRKSFGGLYATNIPTGGEAVKFFSSTVVKLWSSDSDANAIKRKVKSGDKLVEEKVGRAVAWTVEFNKIAPPGRTGSYDFYYEGDFVGVDTVADLVDIAVTQGVISRAGAWYDVEGARVQGREAVISSLREDDELRDRIRDKVAA